LTGRADRTRLTPTIAALVADKRTSDETLPEYDRPPVVETALGVEFEPLTGWTVPYYGRFWERIQSAYPKAQVVPPILSPEAAAETLQDNRLIRCWFLDPSEARLLQVQSDRVVHNWRRVPGPNPYPRYMATLPMFLSAWREFRECLTENEIGPLRVTRCEVTYVNHIVRGEGWSDISDLPSVIRPWGGTGNFAFLPEPQAADMDLHFPMPAAKDRLHIQLRRAVRQPDGTELLQLTITAKGAPRSESEQDIVAWFDLGREWVVRGFTDVTSEKMHQLWGRTR
jgi:uncharacterized protein (TIGR04255 family)